jgi:hypothetical protein
MAKTQKKKTWEAMSRFIRLRDALEYCKEHGIDLHQFARPEDIIGKCCTCGIVKAWIRMDAGHCFGRGSGGHSGVYFHERNVGLQCKPCNAFEQGARPEFEEYLIAKYGDGIIDELRRLHMTNSYRGQLGMLELYFKDEYKKLLART